MSGVNHGRNDVRIASSRKRLSTQILKMVALGVVLLVLGAVPPPNALGRIIRELKMKNTPANRRKVYQHVYYLKRRGYLQPRSGSYEVSPNGRRLLDDTELWNLSVPVPKHWDLAWRLVLFDIPQEKSRVRIRFIRHLQALGFVFYQRSVWVHPYPPEKEVLNIARFLRIEPHVSFVTALNIDGYGSLKKRFGLK